MTSFRLALLVLAVNIVVGSLPVFANIGDPCTANNQCGSLEYCAIPYGDEDGFCAATCGNGVCLAPETHENCPQDCSAPDCPNNICNAWENFYTCPQDCPDNCGNNVCAGGENPNNCPLDCVCGNGSCQTGWENYDNCPADCPAPPPVICDFNNTCDGDESCNCQDCEDESRCQWNPPPPPPGCPPGQVMISGQCQWVACNLGPASCTELNNTQCTYNNIPVDFFVVVDTSSSMAVGSRIFLAETVAKSLRLAAINTPGSTITFFSFDDFGYRWEWSDGEPSAPNLNGWVRYKFPGNTSYGMVDYGSNSANRPLIPPFYDYGLFIEAGSQTNMIEGYNALTTVVQQFPANPNRKKIVYWLSDGEPTVGSENPLCGTGQQPCQTTAAASRADQFRAAYPDIDVVAVGLDTENNTAVDLLQNHVASSNTLFTNASSSTIYGGMTGFCASINNLNHPLNSFSDLYCEEICAPSNGLCGPLNGTSGYNATQLTPSTPGMCAPGLVDQLVSTPGTGGVTYTWICVSPNGGTGSNQCTATKQYCGDAMINGPEVCDTNGNLGCSADQFCSQCNTCVTQGGCGYLDGKSLYDFNNAGDALSGGSLGLCVGGYSQGGTWINYIATGFMYRDHVWTWSCVAENPLQEGQLGGLSAENRIKTSCSTIEMWCGDRTVQNTGNIIYAESISTIMKELETLSEIVGWESPSNLLPGGKTRTNADAAEMQNDLGTYRSHQTRIGSFQVPTEQCETHLDCAQGQNCLGCQCKTIGTCHPDLHYIYAAQETPTYLENGSALCLYGQTANIVYDNANNQWTYQCIGDPGTPTASCDVAHLFCGDGVVNNINSGYPEDFEQCEPTIGVGCTLQCTFETYECQGTIPTNATLCENDDQSLTGNVINSLVGLCTAPQKCEYACDAGYDFNGTHCTQTVACDSKPFNSTWHSGDGSYAQYLSGVTLTPNYSTTHSITNNVNACEFYCNSNYTWNGSACEINMYTVLFSGNGGTGHTPTSKLVTGNTILGTLPTDPTYSGYAFNGWWNQTIGGNSVISTTVITGNRTVYAQWTQLPVTGVCGNAHNLTYPYSIEQYAPDMQCAIGAPTTTAFPAPGGTVTWTCSGLNGGPSSSQCSASRANTPINGACGTADGFVYALTGATYAPLTQCASGTPSNTAFPAPGDSTTRTCDGQYGGLPSATCSASRQSGSCDLTNTYASGSVPGRSCPVGWTLAGGPGCYMCKKDELGIARCLMPECGNGVLDPGEVCDDANINNNDSCTNECQRPYCGDGIYTPSATWTTTDGTLVTLIEMCDPTMTGSSRCPGNCLLTGTLNSSCNVLFPAYLGYNVTEFDDLNQPGSLCFPFGMADPGTHTTDKWKWSCPGINGGLSALGCELPKRRCGDNVLDSWINPATGLPAETCDDGNLISGDGCDETCAIEPVITLASTSGLCTIQSYPQIEVGEYLPIRWAGIRSTHMITGQNCEEIPWNPTINHNGIQRDSIMGNLSVYRGGTTGLQSAGTLNDVKIAQFNTTSQLMITDAIKDFGAEGVDLIGTKLVEPAQIEGWVNTGATPQYGQYLLRLPQINYSYCAWSRDGDGTATGQTNVLSYTENCSNNFDDNGNGLVDCADTVFCGTADNCIVGTGGGGGQYLPETSCTDGLNTSGSHSGIDCADPSCYDAPNCLASVRPEHCANGIDDNGNGLVDCADTASCANVPYCKGKLTTSEQGNNMCSNENDEDLDGLISCNDPSCLMSVANCSVSTIASPYCTDGQDNEHTIDQNGNIVPNHQDGLIDIEDPQCFLMYQGGNPVPTQYYQRENNCYDGNGVGGSPSLVDCADPTCQFFAVCGNTPPFNAGYMTTPRSINPPAEVCNDGIDNDGDGRVDCSDFNCKTSPECGYQSGGGGSLGEICDDGEDNDGDGRIDCADGECSEDPACTVGINENCLNETINDDNDEYELDADDPDCVRWYQFEEGYEQESPLNTVEKDYVYTGSNGYVCESGFSVSKGYFVQQGFAFTEEANAGLNASDFVSIGGVPLVTEGTVLDDGENNVTTYSQQGAKSYLFSGFVDTRELKATNNIQVGSDNGLVFKKVPNAHIYFWQGTSNLTNGQEVLELNEYDRDLLLNRGGVPDGQEAATPYTIVLPGSTRTGNPKQVLDIQGTLLGNAMYVSQGDIKFSSSDGSCDSSDTVEGLFIAAGEFTTDPINNKDSKANRRCSGGNLKINGTLLGSNAGSSLAPLRRSVIDARNPNATFFDNSLVFQAKELFETCYLPALAHRKASTVYTAGGYTSYNGPLANCNIDLLNTATAADRENTLFTSRGVRDYFLTKFTLPGNILATALTCTDTLPTSLCQKSIAFVYDMMDNVQSANSVFVIPSTLKIENTIGSAPQFIVTITTADVEGGINNPQTLLGKMRANNKRFPARWFAGITNMPSPPVGQNYVQVTEDITFAIADKPKLMNDVSKAFGGIKDHFIGFSRPLVNNSNNSVLLLTDGVYGSLYSVFQGPLGSPSSPLRNKSYLPANIASLCPVSAPFDGYEFYQPLNQAGCEISHYPDFRRFVDNKQTANTQGTSLASNIVDGSSVLISSQPKLWTDLPPGAKDFLNNIVVVPR